MNENRTRKTDRIPAPPTPGPSPAEDEALFLAPDRDATGFLPSGR